MFKRKKTLAPPPNIKMSGAYDFQSEIDYKAIIKQSEKSETKKGGKKK